MESPALFRSQDTVFQQASRKMGRMLCMRSSSSIAWASRKCSKTGPYGQCQSLCQTDGVLLQVTNTTQEQHKATGETTLRTMRNRSFFCELTPYLPTRPIRPGQQKTGHAARPEVLAIGNMPQSLSPQTPARCRRVPAGLQDVKRGAALLTPSQRRPRYFYSHPITGQEPHNLLFCSTEISLPPETLATEEQRDLGLWPQADALTLTHPTGKDRTHLPGQRVIHRCPHPCRPAPYLVLHQCL